MRCRGENPGWYLINYDIVSKAFYAPIHRETWDLFVADECQALKSRSAQRALALLGGKRKDKDTGEQIEMPQVPARHKLMLTGTPIMNRPAELFPMLHYLDAKRWATWSGFAKRYCQASYNGFGYDTNSASNLEELNARLRETIMVRQVK